MTLYTHQIGKYKPAGRISQQFRHSADVQLPVHRTKELDLQEETRVLDELQTHPELELLGRVWNLR